VKIDQNNPFSKALVDTSNVTSARDGANVSRAGPRMPAAAAVQAPSLSATLTPLLPSTNGDFDTARVTKIRDDISAGRYKVNTEKIADGLLATVRELIGRKTA
jgi:negative regulator of flagellin synthesis FlgM